MPNRSIRDERDVSTRAGAPGVGSLIGKKEPKPAPAPSPGTEDLSIIGTIGKIKARKSQIDQAIEDAGG